MSYYDYDSDRDDERASRTIYARHPLSDPLLASAFLDQGRSWCVADGTFVLIKDMTAAHALAAASYVLGHARPILLVAGLLEHSDEVARDAVGCSKLVTALVARGNTEAKAPAYPWVAARRKSAR